MSPSTTPPRAKRTKTAAAAPPTAKLTRADQMIDMMRVEGGATARALAEAVGWQVHSVRGFIAGTLKKRPDLIVTAARVDGATRYSVSAAEGPAR